MKINHQSGISLVEVLVSLVISIFLLGGIIQVYVGNKATFTFANSVSQIQENGRFALDTMSQDIRAAGDWGCISFNPNDTANIVDSLPAALDANLFDFPNGNPVFGTNDNGPINSSDVLTIMGTIPGQTNVTAPFGGGGPLNIVTRTINTIQANDILLITRCGTNTSEIEAEIVQATGDPVPGPNPNTTSINFNAALSQVYRNDAVVKELQTVTYTINNGASGEPALFRSSFGVNQELIEGVENMQVLYGIDALNNGFASQYVSANNVADFNDVKSIRIMLLVRSFDTNVTEDAQVYTFNGVQTTAADNRMRQVFTTTIALRNL